MPNDLSDLLLMRRRRRGGGGPPSWVLRNPDDDSVPTLDIDFAGNRAWDGTLTTPAALLTCTRASGGYAETADGTLEWFASNEMRRTDKGLLVEGSRKNLLSRSQEFDNAAWNKFSAGAGLAPVVTANAATAPDGTTTADRVQLSLDGGTTSSDISQLQRAISLTAGPHTLSIYLRSVDGVSTYNMQLQGADGSASSITVTGVWQRFAITATAVGGSVGMGPRLRGGQSPTNADNADILVWGAQLEAAAFPSSYIPTEGSSATRASDLISCPISNIAGFDTAKGALFVSAISAPGTSSGEHQYAAMFTDGTINTIIAHYRDVSDGEGKFFAYGFGSVQAQISAGAISNNEAVRQAGAWQVNDFAVSLNGGSVVTDTSGNIPTGIDRFLVGNRHDLARAFGGYIRRITYFPSRISNAGLQAITS